MQDQFPHHGRPRRCGLVLDREAPVRSLGEGVGRADLRRHCLCHRLLHLGRVQLSVREPVHLNKVGAGREVKRERGRKDGKRAMGATGKGPTASDCTSSNQLAIHMATRSRGMRACVWTYGAGICVWEKKRKKSPKESCRSCRGTSTSARAPSDGSPSASFGT